jgi:hypothetical protein
MNVPLLQATGAGKTVKRAIRAHKKRIGEGGEPDSSAAGADACARLERLLGSWVAMADDPDGIAVGGSHAAAAGCGGGKDANSSGKKISESLAEARGDLRIAEGCRSWRQLFRALKLRDDSRRSDQGERMRKIRSNLARERPRVVKVRPAAAPSARRDRILARPEDRAKLLLSPSPASAKMSQLRRETAVTAVRQQRAPSAPPGALKRPPPSFGAPVASRAPPSGSFGAAVAFAAAAKRPPAAGKAPARAGKATTLVRLPGGREMRVPGAASGRRHPHHPPPPAPGATHKSKAAPGRR